MGDARSSTHAAPSDLVVVGEQEYGSSAAGLEVLVVTEVSIRHWKDEKRALLTALYGFLLSQS